MFTTTSNDTQSGKIGLLQTTSLVTGNLVGSGVFMLPSLLAVYGTVSLAGWLATSAGAIFLALVFSALSKEIHGCNGGPHLFIQRAFGDGAGYYAAWGYWLLTWASNTALLVAAMSYLVKITGPLSLTALLSIQVSIWSLVVLINSYGVQSAARFELLTTVLKLIPIIGIPLFACTSMQWRQFLPLFPAAETTTMWSGLQASIFLTLWAFIGVESATVPSKDVFQPEKTIGRATILALLPWCMCWAPQWRLVYLVMQHLHSLLRRTQIWQHQYLADVGAFLYLLVLSFHVLAPLTVGLWSWRGLQRALLSKDYLLRFLHLKIKGRHLLQHCSFPQLVRWLHYYLRCKKICFRSSTQLLILL